MTVIDLTHLPPRKIQFEITEQAVMRDAEAALSALRATGVRRAPDDIGTGCSGLVRLGLPYTP